MTKRGLCNIIQHIFIAETWLRQAERLCTVCTVQSDACECRTKEERISLEETDVDRLSCEY
jgi:hypothetical protein